MSALKTKSTPELRGLYSNSNRLTQPQGTVPRLCNLYMTRRGAFHTVPGSKWVSAFDGVAPHVTTQLPLRHLNWYAPSSGSSADIYMAQFTSIIPHNFLLALQATATGVSLQDISGATFAQLAAQTSALSLVPTSAQFGDYMIFGFENIVPPNIFPTVTQTTAAVGISDATINVANTTPFASVGYIVIDNEIVGYTTKTPTSFTGLTRGALGTAAATHAAGGTVYLAGTTSAAAPVSTTTTGAIISTDVAVNVAATAAFPMFSGMGLIYIDSEAIGFTGSTATSFTGLNRGLSGTIAASHANGATVFSLARGIGPFNPVQTTTVGAITSGAGSAPVLSTAQFPATGFIVIDAEVIKYASKTATAFNGLTRGQAGTTAASHAASVPVFQINAAVSSVGQVWGPIINNFDPSLIYGQWPGTHNSTLAADSVAVNIGTIIFIVDGAGVSWLFRAQNSGVTAWGGAYYEPQFFPLGLIYSDGQMTSGSPTLTGAIGRFTALMVGQPIRVEGAAAGGGDLLSTVQSFTDASHIVLANSAGATVTSATYTIGVGHYGDRIPDLFQGTKNVKRGTEVWLNIGQAALSPPGAKFVFQHLNSIFLWGVGQTYGPDGITGPDALWQGDFGAPFIYNPASVTFVGKGDGTQAQGGAVYSLSEAGIAATPQLVLFKDASTYSFLNSFPAASLVQVSGGLGCIAPATIQFIGGLGVMRLSYAGVTLFDGQLEHVTEYTDAIRGYLFGGLSDVVPVDFTNIQNCVSTQSVNPPMYVFFAPVVGFSGFVTRMFGYDFGLKQWWTGLLPFAVSAAAFLPQSVVAIAAKYQSLVGGAQDGVVRRMMAGDADWDGVPIHWSVQLPDWGFPGTPTYVRRCNALITADGGGAAPALTAVSFQGIRRSSQQFSRPLNLPISILGSMDVGEVVLNGNLTVKGVGQVLIEGSDAQTSDKPTARVGL
jgi:hypothetical protein